MHHYQDVLLLLKYKTCMYSMYASPGACWLFAEEKDVTIWFFSDEKKDFLQLKLKTGAEAFVIIEDVWGCWLQRYETANVTILCFSSTHSLSLFFFSKFSQQVFCGSFLPHLLTSSPPLPHSSSSSWLQLSVSCRATAPSIGSLKQLKTQNKKHWCLNVPVRIFIATFNLHFNPKTACKQDFFVI